MPRRKSLPTTRIRFVSAPLTCEHTEIAERDISAMGLPTQTLRTCLQCGGTSGLSRTGRSTPWICEAP